MKTNLDKWLRVTPKQCAMLGLAIDVDEVVLVNKDLAERVKLKIGNKINFYLKFYYNAQNEFTEDQLKQIKRADTKWLMTNYEKNLVV